MPKHLKFLSPVLALCFQSALGATEDSLRLHAIGGEAVVTASRPYNDIVPAQQLQGKNLEKMSAFSVADAIRYFSGLQIKDYGGVGGLKTVNIRSLGTNHVGVFYDGIELGNAQNGQIDLGRFSLDNLEAITVYNGQRGAIFQPAKDFGSAGTIYLKSREPRFEAGHDSHFKATLRGGSFATINPSLLAEKKIGDNLSVSASAEYLHSNGRYKYRYHTDGGYDMTSYRRNGDINSYRAEAGLIGRTRKSEWHAKAYIYGSERGLPGAVVRGKLSHEDRQWDTNFFVQGSFKKSFSSLYSLLLNAKYAYDYLHYLSDPNKDESLMFVENRYHQHEAYLSAANLFNISKNWSASLSVDWQANKLNADLYQFAYPTRNTLLAATALQADYGIIKAQASLLATFVSDKTSTQAKSMERKSQYTPTFIFHISPPWKNAPSIRAFYKKIFRMPTLNDLYYTFIGNANLKPEFTTQYDIGLTYSLPSHDRARWLKALKIEADAYHNSVKDKIVAIPTSNQFRWTMLNLGRVRINGIDLSALASLSLPHEVLANIRLSYTYQKAQDITSPNDPFYEDQIPYVPWHSGSCMANISWRMLELNYSFVYTGQRYDQQANIPENYAPEWYTSDIGLACNFTLFGTKARAAIDACNIFNQQFEVVKCYPMPGTNFKATLSIEI